MGWNNQNVFIVLIVSAGSGFSGLFVYSPAPGTGNLVYSVTAAAGTDPYGNAYLAGSTSYSASGVTNENGGVTLAYAPTAAAGNLVESVAPVAGTDSFGNAYVAGVASYVGNQTSVLTGGLVEVTNTLNGSPGSLGAPTGFGGLAQLFSPQTGAGDSPATINLYSKNGTGGPGVASVQVTAGNFISTGGTVGNPSLLTTDTWHSLGTLAGYTVNRARYRLNNEGKLDLSVEVVGGGAQAGTVTFSNTLPAAYRPVTDHPALPMGTTRQQAAGEVSPRLTVTAAGAVTVINDGANTNAFTASISIPIDD